MKGIKNHSVIISVLVLINITLYNCSNGDYTEELSGNYFYRNEGPDTKDILSHSPNRKEIYSKVLSYSYNERFIVAVQMPIYNEYKKMIAFDLRDDFKKYPKNSNDEILKSEKSADSILINDSFYKTIFSNKMNYWIIDHERKLFLGPLSLDEYELKRKQLGVPDNLQLDSQ